MDTEQVKALLCSPLAPRAPWHDTALALAIAAPHFLYAFIWFNPQLWRSMFGKSSVEVFAFCGYMGKVIQFAAVGAWWWASQPTGLCVDLSIISLWQWLLFLVLAGFGQALNVGIYKAIGKDGVYYGFKLGKKIPWVNGFPFNVVSHPQYVGSALTVWGAGALLYNQAPVGSAWIVAMWTLVYVITGLFEQYL